MPPSVGGTVSISSISASSSASWAASARLSSNGRPAPLMRLFSRSVASRAAHYPTDDLDLDFPERDDSRAVAPTKAELQAIIAVATGRWRPLVLVAVFCGLRASELRGVRWEDVNFEEREISIKQRADARNKIGKLKSKTAYRSIPMPPMVLNTLREWRLLCPKGELSLVFPSGAGNVESHSNVAQRGLV
jgi:integrase